MSGNNARAHLEGTVESRLFFADHEHLTIFEQKTHSRAQLRMIIMIPLKMIHQALHKNHDEMRKRQDKISSEGNMSFTPSRNFFKAFREQKLVVQ